MKALGAGGCALLGLLAGVVVNILIDRVPARLALWPVFSLRRRCPSVPPPELPDQDPESEPDTDASPESDEVGRAGGHREAGDADGDGPAQGDGTAYDDAGHGAPALTLPLLGGRCRVCGRRSSVRYPLVELACALLFGGAALRFGADWVLPAYLVFFASLLAISVIDLEHHIIPNRIVYPTIFIAVPLLALAAAVQGEGDRLGDALLGGAVAWTALLFIHLVSPGGMGFGDVRLSFVLGLFLGWLSLRHALTGIFMGFLLGSVVGLTLVAVRLRTRKDHIPFGPFLAAGAVITVFGGSAVNRWWLGA